MRAAAELRTRAGAGARRPSAWMAGSLAVGGLALVAYGAGAALGLSSPGGALSMGFGWAALGLLLALAAFGWRKRGMALASRLGAGRSSLWLTGHLHAGALFLLFVLLHADLSWPRGWVTAWLWTLTLWTVAGGFLGRALQRWLPRLMTSGLSTEVLYERIPELAAELGDRARRLVESSGREIRDVFDRRFATDLDRPRRRWIFLLDITGGIGERLRPLRFLRRQLPDEEVEKLDRLEDLLRAKHELDAHYTLQAVLRGWLWLHTPVAVVLLVLVGIHLWGVLWY